MNVTRLFVPVFIGDIGSDIRGSRERVFQNPGYFNAVTTDYCGETRGTVVSGLDYRSP
jgi:hypothetical protein